MQDSKVIIIIAHAQLFSYRQLISLVNVLHTLITTSETVFKRKNLFIYQRVVQNQYLT